MRNIYDIITEQRSMTDINVASYDLDYTINYFTNNQDTYYLSEGLGETVKNVGQKIVEFIKTVIAKIKDLVRRALDHFKKDKRRIIDVDRINAKADKKDDTVDDNDDEPKADEGKKYERKERKSVKINFEEAANSVKTCQLKVNTIKYVHLNKKAELADKFLNSVYSSSERYISDKDSVVDDLYIKSMLRQAFKGAGAYSKNKDLDIVSRTKLELGESDEPKEYKIADLADEIMSYDNKNDIIDTITNLDKIANEGLNNLRKKIESKEIKDEKSLALVQKSTNMTASFVNFIVTNIVKAFESYRKLAEKAVDDYVDQKFKEAGW